MHKNHHESFSRSSNEKSRIAVAVSGGGRSLENLVRKQQDHRYIVAGVISSRKDCKAVEFAQTQGLALFTADFSNAVSNTGSNTLANKVETDLFQWLETQNISLIALAGFLKKFPLRNSWNNRIINIHPALLPNYGGKGMYGDRVHKAVIAAKEKTSGATIHFVTEDYDDGNILARVKVSLDETENDKSLAEKVFEAECKLYPMAIDSLITGEIPLPNGSVKEY